MRMNPFGGLLLAGVAATTVCSGVPVPIGGTVALSGGNSAEYPEWAGIVENDGTISWEVRNAANGVIMSGEIQNRAVISSASGEINFAPRLRNLVAFNGTARVVGYQTTGFAGFDIDADFAIAENATGPLEVRRSAGDGDTLSFDYTAAPLGSGDDVAFIRIDANSIAFQPIGTARVSVQESPGGAIFSVEVPGIVVPIPADPSDLKVLSTGRLQAGQVSIRWIGIPNRWHDFYFSNDLIIWEKFTSGYCDGNEVVTNFFPQGSPTRQYYRIELP